MASCKAAMGEAKCRHVAHKTHGAMNARDLKSHATAWTCLTLNDFGDGPLLVIAIFKLSKRSCGRNDHVPHRLRFTHLGQTFKQPHGIELCRLCAECVLY